MRRRAPRAAAARLTCLACLTCLTCLTNGAAAQPPAAADRARRDSLRADSASAADRARRISPVVVTVLRTPVDLARAPFAVSVNTADDVRRARPGLAIDEALRAVPGVQVDNRFNAALGERISVRGFGARTTFGVRGVKVLVDGVPATMPDGQTTLNHVELGALARAEVVRGPSSALYGNAAGGVILLESAPPPDAPVAGSTRLLAGSDGLRRTQAELGGRGRRGDWAAHAGRVGYEGYRAYSDQRTTRVLLRGRVGDVARGGEARVTYAYADYDARNPGSLPAALRSVAPDTAWPNNVRQQTGEAGHHGQLGIVARARLGPGELSANYFTLRRRLDNPIPPAVIALRRVASGARLAYAGSVAPPGGRVAARLTGGAEIQGQDDLRENWVNQGGARGALTLDQFEAVTSVSPFVQADATLGTRVTLLGGVRYDNVRFEVRDRLVAAQNPDDSGDRRLAAVSPSLGVSVALTPRVRVYANTGTAFETPTTTELANRPTGAGGFNPDLSPQRTRSAELGLNAGFVLGTWGAGTTQLAAYDARVRDALVPFEVPGAAGRQFFRNAGRLRHRGVEAAASLAVGSRLTTRVAYTLVDARFDRYTVGDSSYAGRRVPGVAPRRADVTLEWRGAGSGAGSGDGDGAFVALDLRAQSWTPADDANRARSPGYAVIGGRVAAPPLRFGGSAFAPFAGVTNAFDVRYDAAVTVNAAGARYFEPGPGRAFYVGADITVGRRR